MIFPCCFPPAGAWGPRPRAHPSAAAGARSPWRSRSTSHGCLKENEFGVIKQVKPMAKNGLKRVKMVKTMGYHLCICIYMCVCVHVHVYICVRITSVTTKNESKLWLKLWIRVVTSMLRHCSMEEWTISPWRTVMGLWWWLKMPSIAVPRLGCLLFCESVKLGKAEVRQNIWIAAQG